MAIDLAMVYYGYNGYNDEKCARCEALKLKVKEYKRMISSKNKTTFNNVETTSLWLRKREALVLKQTKSLKIHCYECKDNEEALKWYQSLYKMSIISIKNF